jgi:hypothetical protein
VTSMTGSEESQQLLDRISAAISDSRNHVRKASQDLRANLDGWAVKFFSDNLVLGYSYEDSGIDLASAAKFVGFFGRIPFFAVPISLSNDGICSPQSSLTIRGKRRSFAIRSAPSIKQNYYTILSSRDVIPEVERLLSEYQHLTRCFRD